MLQLHSFAPLLLLAASGSTALAATPLSDHAQCIHYLSPVLIVCTDQGLAYSYDQGASFTLHGAELGLPSADIQDAYFKGEWLYAVTADSKTVRTKDGKYFGPLPFGESADPKVAHTTARDDSGGAYDIRPEFMALVYTAQGPPPGNETITLPLHGLPDCGPAGCPGKLTGVAVTGKRVWISHSVFGVYYSDDLTDTFKKY
jgi:hypothetical protein